MIRFSENAAMAERTRILKIRTERSVPDRLLLCMAALVFGLAVGTLMAGLSQMTSDLLRGRLSGSPAGMFFMLQNFVIDHWIGGAAAGFLAGLAYRFGGMRSVLAGFFGVMATFMIVIVIRFLEYPHFGILAAMLNVPRELPVHAVIAVIPSWGLARLLRIV